MAPTVPSISTITQANPRLTSAYEAHLRVLTLMRACGFKAAYEEFSSTYCDLSSLLPQWERYHAAHR